MQADSRRTNAERSGTMRARLVAAARGLFVEKGFDGTGTPELVAAAGVTRGALYHHFADKAALFRAVVEAEAAAVAAEIRAAAVPLEPRAALLAGGEAFLAAMAVPGRARLLLLDGPAVLGRAAMDEIDSRTGGATLAEGLAEMGLDGPLRELAALLSAAHDRAALALAAGEPAAPWRAALRRLVAGLG